MNWVCESCGYENEYNDESQPTECLCCGEPASEHQLNQAKQELEKYHKEQARQRRLEQLRQEAIKQQEKIEHSIDAFAKGIKGIAAACIVAMILAVAIAGLNVCQGNITLKYIGTNIKNISVVDNVTDVTENVSEHLRENTLEYKNNIVRNVSFTTKSKDHSVLAHLGLLMENRVHQGCLSRLEVTLKADMKTERKILLFQRIMSPMDLETSRIIVSCFGGRQLKI